MCGNSHSVKTWSGPPQSRRQNVHASTLRQMALDRNGVWLLSVGEDALSISTIYSIAEVAFVKLSVEETVTHPVAITSHTHQQVAYSDILRTKVQETLSI